MPICKVGKKQVIKQNNRVDRKKLVDALQEHLDRIEAEKLRMAKVEETEKKKLAELEEIEKEKLIMIDSERKRLAELIEKQKGMIESIEKKPQDKKKDPVKPIIAKTQELKQKTIKKWKM